MPNYEFECNKCKKRFEVFMRMSEVGTKKPACPKCKSRSTRQILSSFSAKTSRKS